MPELTTSEFLMDLDAGPLRARLAACAADVLRLAAENARLREAVQLHHDQRGDDRCHLDDARLYHDALGIGPDPYVTALPPEPDMMESCRRYVRQRQCPAVAGAFRLPGGMTIAQLTAEVERLKAVEAQYDLITAHVGELMAARQQEWRENHRLEVANARLVDAWPEAVGGVWRDAKQGVWHCCPASSVLVSFGTKAEAVACVAANAECGST